MGSVSSVLGGFLMYLGSRIAGGCTSGHGVSGASELWVESLIAVVFMFGSGMLLAAIGF